MDVIIGVSGVLVQFFVYNIATDISVVTGLRECCSDYRNVSGKCAECIGLFGKNCTTECSDGYYGHGCRYRCNCTEQFQICDSKHGCVEDSTRKSNSVSNSYEYEYDSVSNSYGYALCGFMFLLIMGVITYFNQKMRKRSMSSGRSSDKDGEKQDIQGDGIYSYIKEPRIHDQSRNFDLPNYSCNSTEPNRVDKAKNKTPSQVRLPLTRSEMLDSNVYDLCNRLNSPSSSPIYSSVINHDYDFACFKSSRSLSLSKLEDNNGSRYHKENNEGLINQYDEFRPMMNRPYSSVKYDRQTTTDTNDE